MIMGLRRIDQGTQTIWLMGINWGRQHHQAYVMDANIIRDRDRRIAVVFVNDYYDDLQLLAGGWEHQLGNCIFEYRKWTCAPTADRHEPCAVIREDASEASVVVHVGEVI